MIFTEPIFAVFIAIVLLGLVAVRRKTPAIGIINFFQRSLLRLVEHHLPAAARRRRAGRLLSSAVDRWHHHYFMFMATGHDWETAGASAIGGFRLSDYLTLSPHFRSEAESLASVTLPFAIKGLYFGFREYAWKTPPVPSQDHDGFLPVPSVYTFRDPAVIVSNSDDSRSDVRLTPWLVQIAQLCREHHAELYFLFTPQRNEAYPGPKFLAALREWGRSIVLDARAYYQPGLWYNPTHLNTAGARVFTEELLASELFSASTTPPPPAAR